MTQNYFSERSEVKQDYAITPIVFTIFIASSSGINSLNIPKIIEMIYGSDGKDFSFDRLRFKSKYQHVLSLAQYNIIWIKLATCPKCYNFEVTEKRDTQSITRKQFIFQWSPVEVNTFKVALGIESALLVCIVFLYVGLSHSPNTDVGNKSSIISRNLVQSLLGSRYSDRLKYHVIYDSNDLHSPIRILELD